MNQNSKVDVIEGDCLQVVSRLSADSYHLIYLDPPFFTQKQHKLTTRDSQKEFSFDDLWNSRTEYADFLFVRLKEFYRILTFNGAIFFHCNRESSSIARILLDDIFGSEMFRAEIIWTYRRWSNSARQLLPAHQTILYYTKSDEYIFNTKYTEYSPTTNVDQILQRREKNEHGKSVYKRDHSGKIIPNGAKPGVPLSDVWDIPYLNPKAKERVGYPTQKPVILLERIIELASSPMQNVLDPFCGSGTTLVASKLRNRNALGIDISADAVGLSRQRLMDLVISHSRVHSQGRDAFQQIDQAILNQLEGIEYVPVQRNGGIDAFLKQTLDGTAIPVRIQRASETITEAAYKLHKAACHKGIKIMILIANANPSLFNSRDLLPLGVIVIDSVASSIKKRLSSLVLEQNKD